MTPPQPDTRLYLELDAADGAAERLSAALAAAPAEAVLIRHKPGERANADLLRGLIGQAQAHGAAALVAHDVVLARAVRADGVHLPWSIDVAQACAAARKALGTGSIVGAMAGSSRHDAMMLGEAGADYIGFAATPQDAGTRLALVEWWAEIFAVPCVAFGVTTAREADLLCRAGADFIAVPVGNDETPAAAADRVRAVAAALEPRPSARTVVAQRGPT